MAKTFVSPYVQNFRPALAVVTLASTVGSGAEDAPTSTAELATGAADGSLVIGVTAIPRATVTASALQLFVVKKGETAKRLQDAVTLPGQTVSATMAATKVKFADITPDMPILLAEGDKLYAASGVALAAGIVFSARVGDF